MIKNLKDSETQIIDNIPKINSSDDSDESDNEEFTIKTEVAIEQQLP
jgi:hypothetical protein